MNRRESNIAAAGLFLLFAALFILWAVQPLPA